VISLLPLPAHVYCIEFVVRDGNRSEPEPNEPN